MHGTNIGRNLDKIKNIKIKFWKNIKNK